MYRRKHKQSALIRIFFGICLLAGVFWLLKNPGFIRSSLRGFKLEGGNVLGISFKTIARNAQESVKKAVGERVKKFKVQSSKFKVEEGKTVFKFAIVADSHEGEVYFPMILERIKGENVDFLIHLGDLVNSGDLEKLKQAKDFLDNSGVSYHIIPGDHDYNWQPTHSLANFKQVFGIEQIYPPIRRVYTSFEHKGVLFILFDNSDNVDEVDVGQMKWLKEKLASTINNQQSTINNIFLFSHKPLANPYFPDKVDPNSSEVLALLAEYKVAQVFSGNVHTFARYPDSQTGIEITTIGAAGTYKNPLPQYVLVTVSENGSFDVEAKPYKELKTEN